jgi:hypothetical protein
MTDGILINILKYQGIVNWDYLTARQLERTPEKALDYRVIFLPVSQCISESEASALRTFVQQGGLLVAVGPAGNRSEYGGELTAGRLDDVFGVKMSAPSVVRTVGGLDLRFTWKDGMSLPLKTRPGGAINASVAATGGRVLADLEGVPLLVHNRMGKGDALLLNLTLARSERPSASEVIAELLRGAGVSAPVRFSPAPGPIAHEPAGDSTTGGVRSRYGLLQKRDLTLLGVITDPHHGQWNGGKVILPQPQHVYDVREGRYLGKLREIQIVGKEDVNAAWLFALQDERIKGVTLGIRRSATPGATVTIECRVTGKGGLSTEGRIVRMELRGPDGKKREHYRRMVHLDKRGRGRAAIQFAFNDLPGKWSVIATDIASGLSTESRLLLRERD